LTYESLLYATRARLHEQLACYLETSSSDAPPLDALAYHYGQRTNTAKQREYFQKAAAVAQAAFANDAALAYYARLLPLLDAPAAQADAHLQWGAVLELVGRWAEAETHYRDALVLAAQDAASTACAAGARHPVPAARRLSGGARVVGAGAAVWAALGD